VEPRRDRRNTPRGLGRRLTPPGRVNVRYACSQQRRRGSRGRSPGLPRASKGELDSGGSFPRRPPIASDTALMITTLAITNTMATMRGVMAQSTPAPLRRRHRALNRAPRGPLAGNRRPTDRYRPSTRVSERIPRLFFGALLGQGALTQIRFTDDQCVKTMRHSAPSRTGTLVSVYYMRSA
jgi:hypothetical protein